MAMVTDPVCGVQIDDGDAEAESTHNGIVYYFTSVECKDRFEEDPEAFVGDHWLGDDVSDNQEVLPS